MLHRLAGQVLSYWVTAAEWFVSVDAGATTEGDCSGTILGTGFGLLVSICCNTGAVLSAACIFSATFAVFTERFLVGLDLAGLLSVTTAFVVSEAAFVTVVLVLSSDDVVSVEGFLGLRFRTGFFVSVWSLWTGFSVVVKPSG